MRNFGKMILTGLVCFGVSIAFVFAQSKRLDPIEPNSNLLKGDEPQLTAPKFPVLQKTGNDALDEQRFTEMVNAWNAKYPENQLDQFKLVQIRYGQLSQKEFLQSSRNTQIQEKAKEPIAKQYLANHKIGKLWGFPGLPEAPVSEASPEDFQQWIDACYKWIDSNPEALAKVKGVPLLPEYPFKDNPQSDPDFPVFRSTGNTSIDEENYHQQKLRYSAKLSNYRSIE